MPFNLVSTDCSPLVIDYDYEINDVDLLATLVGEMVLGHHFHVRKVINSLAVNFPIQPNDAIDFTINKLQSANIDKRDGWLFQMISWVVLAKRNVGRRFYINYPHFAPAQHGIDGLAILLNDDDSLNSIIITEDKCTTGPRGKITQQVFPEFREFEIGNKNNALVSIISSLISEVNAGNVLEQVQNDIFQPSFRIYRIGITREEGHNSQEGRRKLFDQYETFVSGDTPERRTAATIHIPNLREWMSGFSKKVIGYLESKKV